MNQSKLTSITASIYRACEVLSVQDKAVVHDAIVNSNVLGVDPTLLDTKKSKLHSIALPNRFNTSIRYVELSLVDNYIVNVRLVSVTKLHLLESA